MANRTYVLVFDETGTLYTGNGQDHQKGVVEVLVDGGLGESRENHQDMERGALQQLLSLKNGDRL